MAPAGSKVQQFLLHAIFPILCSVVVGYFFFQDGVFNRQHGAFQFLWSAVVASLFYYLLVYLRPRDAYLGLLVLFLLTLATTQSTRPAYILRDIFYVGTIGVSMLVYFKYFMKAASINLAFTALILAGIYGLAYGIAAEVHLAILQAFALESTGGTLRMIGFNSVGFGLWIGFAVGAGITIAEKIFPAKNR
jgi:hypothetical protein